MRIAWLCIVIIFALSCNDESDFLNEINSANSLLEGDDDMAISYLALGDSYSVGEGLVDKKNWPSRLSDSLLTENNEVSYTVIGETGFSTRDLIQKIKNTKFESTFNLISIQIGVNDQFRQGSINTFKTDFSELLLKIKKLNSTRDALIFAVSIPDWGATPFGFNFNRKEISNEINKFNAVLLQVCNLNSIPFVDITTVSRISPNDSTLVTNDGLHPSDKMYGFWLNEIVPVVENLLN